MESNGDIVILGRKEDDHPPALHIYKKGIRLKRAISLPCHYQHELKILPVMIENNERLLLSCWQCYTIWFCNIDSGKFNEALKEEGFFPWLMCKAEEGYILVANYAKGHKSILKAKCSASGINLDKTKSINSRLKNISFICYLPNLKSVTISGWIDHVVKVIHCETGEQVWEVKGQVEGVTWDPLGLLYLPKHQSLLVCDQSERLVAINSIDGSVLQVIPILKRPGLLSLHGGNIVLSIWSTHKISIDLFTIT